ncbi:hypothetical protein E7T09_08485 [Deinococcus sp. KSM4-11]|uniref:hypothetical protein n=1 Tax=Deinococcus sp. KSM4-11 TaxID=2568654 RepID=UPI0011389E89|nr:hypothetical protein [Deinococcus sp. KSM4-11]THF87183.1 hypothetical protein E7T09_08485 [Deinococcus sp. KSM4-11]
MVTWSHLEDAQRDGRVTVEVPCYRIGTTGTAVDRITRGSSRAYLTLARATPAAPRVSVDVILLTEVVERAPIVVSEIDLPSERVHPVWQVIALNRETVLMLLLALSTGLDVQFLFHEDLVWLRPIPEVWSAGSEAWALVAVYR